MQEKTLNKLRNVEQNKKNLNKITNNRKIQKIIK